MGESEAKVFLGAYELIKEGEGISSLLDRVSQRLEKHPLLRCAPEQLEALRPVLTLFLIQVLGGPITSADADLVDSLRAYPVTHEKLTAGIVCLEQALQEAGAGAEIIREVVQRVEACRSRLVSAGDR